MVQDSKKEWSYELLIKAREESFIQNGIYSPISSMTAPEDKERLTTFHEFFNERFKKMFAPLVEENLDGKMSKDFLDKFTFCYWDTDEANACCWPKELPDGRIYVAITKGMIDLCETEGELMGIVGHEIGHHIHHLMKPYGNNEAEEQGSDIIAMTHMPNAGYHPREMISAFNKLSAKYSTPSEKKGRLNIIDIFDPHPDIEMRDSINKMYVQIDDHKYAHLTETPLDKTDIALSALVPMDHALRIDDNFFNVDGQKRLSDFKRILDDAEALQVSLVSEYPLMDSYMENIWNNIIAEYLSGKENKAGIELKNEENQKNIPYEMNILNGVYWKKLGKLDGIQTPNELLSPLWDKMGQTEPSSLVASDLYKLECSMLNRFLRQGHIEFPYNLDVYFEYETLRQKFMPAEIVEARAYIKELLDHPEKISPAIIPSEALSYETEKKLKNYMATIKTESDEERQKNTKLKRLFSRLSNMVNSGYLSHKNVGYLLNPVIEVKEGEAHPLYQVTHATQKYTSDDFYEKQFLDDINPVKRLLATLGYYDSQTFPLDSDIRNLLTDFEFMRYSYLGLNNQDIQNMDDHSIFIVSNGEGAMTCEYNNKTRQITEIRPAQTWKIEPERIGIKCYNDNKRVYDGQSFSVVNSELDMALKTHHAKLYEIKTRHLNTIMHYNLKAMVQSFGDDNISAEQVHDLVAFSKHYMIDMRMRGGKKVSLRRGAPFVLDGMDWDYNIENHTPADMKKSISDEHLFDFLTLPRFQETHMNVAKGYIQLLERGLTDTEVAKHVIRASFYEKAYDGTLHPVYENPALFVLNSECEFLMNNPSDNKKIEWSDYVATHFRRRIFAALNQPPYLDEINEFIEFKADEYGGNKMMLEDMYELAPALCAKVFALYEEDENGHRTYMDLPVKTFSELQKMKDLYDKNKEKLRFGNKEKLEMLMIIAHDKYIEDNHIDVPVLFSIAISEPMICSYTRNVSRIENWPKSLKQSMEIMTQYAGKKTKEGDIFQDVAPQSIIDDYQNMILSSPTFEAKLSVLSWAVQGQDIHSDGWRLNEAISHRLLDIDGEKTIWNNSIDDNVRLYLWLNDRNAFRENIGLQTKIAKNLIDQLEQSPIEKQEEYSFLLLGERADIPSPVNKQRLMEMWVKSVAELVGSKDDMSDDYLKKIQPYIHKLHNRRKKDSKVTKRGRRNSMVTKPRFKPNDKNNKRSKAVSDYIYTKLEPDMKNELSKMLQESLVSQPKLSAILQPEEHIGLAANERNVFLGGKIIKILSMVSRPADAIATINFLLNLPTPENIENWSDSIGGHIKAHFRTFLDKKISYDEGKNFHDEFWSKDFTVRLVALTELFNRGYPDELNQEGENGLPSQKRLENMLNRILDKKTENRDAFYSALYNYATAVDDKEMYKADSLLAGCLASAPKEPNNQMNIGEIIRKFLESQGAAGIKVGQFLSAHEDIPAEVRLELKKLTNHASTPSRGQVFEIIREKHPELMRLVIQNGGLGKCLGAASHYLTYEMGDQVISVSRPESAAKASVVYKRLLKAIGKTLEDQPQNAHLLHVIRDAVTQAQSMNDVELNGNIGYEQSILATRLYDNVEMNIDGHSFVFKTMPWVKPDEKTGPYHVVVEDISGYQYSQSFKIMEKAGGIDYDKIQDKDYKKAVAKANFLLNLRTILMGDVFDDDRHTGQLKVERLSDNSTRINLFDTGSMSTEPPTKEELNSFGQALHATSRAIIALRSNGTQEQKMATLHRVFPSADTFDNLFDTNGQISETALTICFNLAVNELRDEQGYAPLYISKVERSLANLSHFSNDIPADEMLPLVSHLIQSTGNIHPEIIAGMGKDNFILDHLIMQKILPNGKFNVDFIEKTLQSDGMHFISLNDRDIPYSRAEETETITGSVQHEKEKPIFEGKTNIEFKKSQEPNNMTEQIIQINTEEKYATLEFDTIKTGLDELLRPSDIENREDKKNYDEALVNMCFPTNDISFIDHMNDTLNGVSNPIVRQKLAKKMLNVVHNATKKLQNGTQADAITKEIYGYLKKIGIPNHLVNKMAKRLPFKKAVALRLAFFRGGKLTLGSKAVMRVLGQNITKIVQSWDVFDTQKRQVMLDKTRLVIGEAQEISNVRNLQLSTEVKIESASNKTARVMIEAYSSNAREIKTLKAAKWKIDEAIKRATSDKMDALEVRISPKNASTKIGNLLKKLSFAKNESVVEPSICNFNGSNLNKKSKDMGKR